MDPATIIFAALLPISIMSVPIVGFWTHHKRKMAELQMRGSTVDKAAFEELEERLRIVERIVTDKGFDVSSQIEALREKPRQLDRQR